MESFKSGGFSMVGVYAFIGGIAAMCFVLLAVTAYQNYSNKAKALQVLAARLQEKERSERAAKEAARARHRG